MMRKFWIVTKKSFNKNLVLWAKEIKHHDNKGQIIPKIFSARKNQAKTIEIHLIIELQITLINLNKIKITFI